MGVGTVVIVRTTVRTTTYYTYILRYFSSGREFDLSEVRNLGLSKILNTIFVILFAMFDVLVCESCCCCFCSHASTCLQYKQSGPSQRSGPPKLARGSSGDREA